MQITSTQSAAANHVSLTSSKAFTMQNNALKNTKKIIHECPNQHSWMQTVWFNCRTRFLPLFKRKKRGIYSRFAEAEWALKTSF